MPNSTYSLLGLTTLEEARGKSPLQRLLSMAKATGLVLA